MLRCPMDPKGASRKWTKTRKPNEKLVCVCMHVPCDYKIPKKQISCHRDFSGGRGFFGVSENYTGQVDLSVASHSPKWQALSQLTNNS